MSVESGVWSLEFGVWSVELSGYSVSLCYFEKTVILRSVATKNLSGITVLFKRQRAAAPY